MAKRKAPSQSKARKPAPKKKPAAKKSTKKASTKVAQFTPKKARSVPKQVALPGTEGVRIKVLDDIFHGIATARENLAHYREEDKSLTGEALRTMQKHGETYYKSHGIEAFVVEGDQKLRVRMVKDQNTGDDEQLDLGDAEIADPTDFSSELAPVEDAHDDPDAAYYDTRGE